MALGVGVGRADTALPLPWEGTSQGLSVEPCLLAPTAGPRQGPQPWAIRRSWEACVESLETEPSRGLGVMEFPCDKAKEKS